MPASRARLGRETLRKEKAELRARMRDLRRTLPPEERTRLSARIEEALFGLSLFQNARTVLLFSSFGAEVTTQGICARLLSEGRTVLLPFFEDDVMHGGLLRPDDELLPSSYGPMEPPSRTPVDPVEVDLVVAPGLAFDREGFRIGYGGGHYDRFLRTLRADATRIGIAFHMQMVDRVPHNGEDEPVDVVVTDQEAILCQRPPL